MAKYVMEVEAFQYLGKAEMNSYPDWFKEEIAAGLIAPCEPDFHVVGGDHIEPGDYIVQKMLDEATCGVVPAEEFELAFVKVEVQ